MPKEGTRGSANRLAGRVAAAPDPEYMTRLIDALGPGLAATVNALRIERDVSRKAFAAALGLSLGGIDDRLAGRQPFTLLDVAVIADLFNVSIDYLVRTSRHD